MLDECRMRRHSDYTSGVYLLPNTYTKQFSTVQEFSNVSRNSYLL